jgi:hypothetical protein
LSEEYSLISDEEANSEDEDAMSMSGSESSDEHHQNLPEEMVAKEKRQFVSRRKKQRTPKLFEAKVHTILCCFFTEFFSRQVFVFVFVSHKHLGSVVSLLTRSLPTPILSLLKIRSKKR